MKKRPEKFNYQMIRSVLSESKVNDEGLLLTPDFAIINRFGAQTLFEQMMQRQVPLLIDDYRMGLVMSGEVHVCINLIDRVVKPGMIAFFAPGTIVQPQLIVGDLRVVGMAWFADVPFAPSHVPSIARGEVRDFQLAVNDDVAFALCCQVEALWQMAHMEPMCSEAIASGWASLMWLYDQQYRLSTQQAIRASHSSAIFNRFIALVNEHCRSEHQLAFYADRLCLTERHLGSVVTQVSGKTAKQWIDSAIVTHIKVALRHSDKTMQQISDEMHFPNASFFSKYFRRLTGVAPGDYRKGL